MGDTLIPPSLRLRSGQAPGTPPPLNSSSPGLLGQSPLIEGSLFVEDYDPPGPRATIRTSTLCDKLY